MEQVNENANKNLPNYKTRKSLAITSFILGVLPFIHLILEKLKSPISDFEFFCLIAIFSPIFAVIYGIIALTERENKFFSLAGIILGILSFFFVSTGVISDSIHSGVPRDAHFKATASSMVPAAIICCDSAKNSSIQTVLGADACNPAIGAIWPDASQVGTITVGTNCQADGSFSITITPGDRNSGTCTNAICTQEGCIFTDC